MLRQKKYYQLTINMNNINAQYKLVYLYENGLGIEQNRKEALKYYKLADKEFTSVQYKLKYLYKDTIPLHRHMQSIFSKIKNLIMNK